MAAEIPLTDKQIKKVYNFFKRDIKYRREHFQFSGPRPGGTPPPGFSPVDPEEIERYNARQEKKLRKIIGDQNYVKWRANHPAGNI